jgi:hypothetical protein
MHVAHLAEECPEVLEFLALPPGWRYLVAGEHIDVWYDQALLHSDWPSPKLLARQEVPSSSSFSPA